MKSETEEFNRNEKPHMPTPITPETSTNTPAARMFISDLGPSQRVRGVFSVANTQLGRTRNDKPYLRCLVGDRTGDLPARMWTIEEHVYNKLPTDGFVFLEGETQPYQGELQLIIHEIEPVEPSAAEMRDLLPCSTRPAEEMYAELMQLLETLQHPSMKALAKLYLADTTLMDAFKQAPAAKSMHHAYLGGLLEHTLNLLNVANAICPFYPKINRDLVMMGLFLHDLGKTRELVYDRAFGYTDRGELIGHIVEGAIMLHDKAQQLMREHGVRVPSAALMVLQHIIISHHGEPEFGAAKLPSTPEAILVAQLDNLDAKAAASVAATRPDRAAEFDAKGNFTEKSWALNTKLYKPDPLKG